MPPTDSTSIVSPPAFMSSSIGVPPPSPLQLSDAAASAGVFKMTGTATAPPSNPDAPVGTSEDNIFEGPHVPIISSSGIGNMLSDDAEDADMADSKDGADEANEHEEKKDDTGYSNNHVVSPIQRRKEVMRGGHKRKALLETHMRKPKISVHKLKLYLRWVNSLEVWPKRVELGTLHIDLCNGLLLCRLMKALVPSTAYTNLHKRPLSKKPALANIEQALSVIWRRGRVNNSRIPPALDIYQGNTAKIVIMISEIFEVYVARPLKKKVPDMLGWMNMILKQYNRPLSADAMSPPYTGLYTHFTSGVSLFCLIFHFHGKKKITRSDGSSLSIDPSELYQHPKNLSEYRSNITVVFNILKALQIECYWEVDEFINFHNTDFLLLQIYKVFSSFVEVVCALPPAHGDVVGVSANKYGEPIITGMVFKEVKDSKRNSDVLIGHGNGQSVRIPGVVRDSKAFKPHFPAGLTGKASFDIPSQSEETNHVQSEVLNQTPVATKKPAMNEGDKQKSALQSADRNTRIYEKNEENYEPYVPTEISRAIAALEAERTKHEAMMEEAEADLIKRYEKLAAASQEGAMTQEVHENIYGQCIQREKELYFERETYKKNFEHAMAKLRVVPTELSALSSPCRGKSSALSKEERAADEAKKRSMEVGWVSQTRSKRSTHNASLKQKQEESEAQIARTMTRKNGVSFSPFNPHLKKLVSVQQWEDFAGKMRVKQEAWLKLAEATTNKDAKSLRDQRLARSPSAKGRKSSYPTNNSGKELGEVMSQIRREELRLMAVEEERRLMVIQEGLREKLSILSNSAIERERIANRRSPSKSPIPWKERQEELELLAEETDDFATANKNFVDSMNAPNGTSSPSNFSLSKEVGYDVRKTTGSSPTKELEETVGVESSGAVNAIADQLAAANLEATNSETLPWLMTARKLILKERNSERWLDFCVMNGADVCPNDPVRSRHYALHWGAGDAMNGFLSVVDISDVRQSQDPSTMVISLKQPSAQAVRNSGGLQMLVIKTNSFPDCTKYVTGLLSLMRSIDTLE